MRQLLRQAGKQLKVCAQPWQTTRCFLQKLCTLPPNVPQLDAGHVGHSHDRAHVSQIHHFLDTAGILKVNLHFEDSSCRYLEQVVRSLNREHGHGLPIDHSASRGWFWDVRPVCDNSAPTTPTSKGTAGRRPRARSETMNTFPWHTDCSYENSPPRFFALQVLYPDKCGGGVLSVLPVDCLLARLSSGAREALSTAEYRIQVPPEFIKDSDQLSIVGPVLAVEKSSHAGTPHRPQLRFRADIFTPLTGRAEAALQELRSLLHGPDIAKEVLHLTPALLPEGTLILLDNRRWLHARNEVKDPDRHLRRVRWDARPFGEECPK
ncbi:hypothetical protein ARAM_007205 [Aspergillus rambellii]|uniref:TauD/TfdA-like domain-containing protein n=1 Tax=Aspergillus rambellii TaxID=308745 RepID=A0A0F8XRU4_9EURO|nr:hypothetical protein ARAM_007205 [Aspergillus rambellii]